MSGITGIIGPSVQDPASVAQVALMASLLQGGSCDQPLRGNVRNEPLGADVSWARRDYEPECVGWNEDRDICLIFSGEDFDLDSNFARLTGPKPYPATSAKVLVSLYEEFGPDFVESLNGRFSGVVLDVRKGAVTLFNDRYGSNRLYFHASADGFHFASEAKCLLAALPHLREIDQRGLAEYYSVGCVLQDRSLFKGVSLLPPSSSWTFERDGRIRKHRYFNPSTWEEQEPLTAADYTASLVSVFGGILPKYLKADAPVAMSLTGGLDSRMILAWAGAAPGQLPCYTFGGPYRECADVSLGRRLAEICHQPHTTIPILPDFFAGFLDLARKNIYVTDGTMDVSGAVELYVNERARQIAPIRVTGNYGSEILRSNVAFRPGKLDRSLFTPAFVRLLEEAERTYRIEASGHRMSFIAFKQVPWHHHARFAAEQSQLSPRSPFLDNELVALAYRAPLGLEKSAAPILKLITEGNPGLDAVPTDRALQSRRSPISGLRQRWQEFTVKAEYAYDYGMPPWLVQVDTLLKPLHLERHFLGRHKFYHFRIWYRDQLSAVLRNQFPSDHQPMCYQKGAAKKLVEDHIAGRANRTSELHKLLTVDLLERFAAS